MCIPEWPDFSEQIRPKKNGRKEVPSLFIAAWRKRAVYMVDKVCGRLSALC